MLTCVSCSYSEATASPPAASKQIMDAAASHELGTEVLSAIRSMKKDFTEKFEDVLAGISGLKN